MPDFPAAHSMDSTWFALDEQGEVAHFDTSEGGSMPLKGFPTDDEGGYNETPLSLDANELLTTLLMARAADDEALRSILPDTALELRELLELAYDERDSLLRAVGLWTYTCDDGAAVPYAREGAPHRALTRNDLDTETAAKFEHARLPVRFADAPRVAPARHVECQSWGTAWVDLDGTVHPNPGETLDDDERAELEDWIEGEDHSRPSDRPAPTPAPDEFHAYLARVLALSREQQAEREQRERRRASQAPSVKKLLSRLARKLGLRG